MLRADHLIVVHHDDTTSEFTDVTYAFERHGLRVVNAHGAEQVLARHDILTIHARLAHQQHIPQRAQGCLAAMA